MRILIAGLLASVATNGAVPQQAPMAMPLSEATAQSVCPRDAVPLPDALSGWAHRTALTAAVDSATLAHAALLPGAAVDLALAPTPAVSYALRSSHPGGSVSHGGMATLTIATAGTYRIGIGSGAWIDLVKDGVSLMSIGHGHGPACSGIRKMVDFALQPGTYVLQIAGNGEATLPLIVAQQH